MIPDHVLQTRAPPCSCFFHGEPRRLNVDLAGGVSVVRDLRIAQLVGVGGNRLPATSISTAKVPIIFTRNHDEPPCNGRNGCMQGLWMRWPEKVTGQKPHRTGRLDRPIALDV
jgi:hypothetical protein